MWKGDEGLKNIQFFIQYFFTFMKFNQVFFEGQEDIIKKCEI